MSFQLSYFPCRTSALRKALSICKSEKILLQKDADISSVNGSVVVDQRFALFLLGLKLVHVLPGCEETNQGRVGLRNRRGPKELPQST